MSRNSLLVSPSWALGRRSGLALAALLAPWALARGQPLGPVEPTAEEQLGIYELNRARNDPKAYGDSIGVNLRGVAAQPPLALNLSLTGSARFHALEMENDAHEYFAHVSLVTGDGPNKMAVQNGYDLFGEGLDPSIWGTTNTIESIARGINRTRTFPEALAVLIEDDGVADLGHRRHLLAMVEKLQEHREVGMGKASGKLASSTEQIPASFVGKPQFLYVIHTANVSPGDRFITGVVYEDHDKDGRYDLSEGVGGVTVSAVEVFLAAGGIRPHGLHSGQTVSLAAGGYSLRLPPASYLVTASGPGFKGVSSALATLGSGNVEVDFASGVGVGEVDFELRDGPPRLQRCFSITNAKAKRAKTGRWTVALQGVFLPGVAEIEGNPIGSLTIGVEAAEPFHPNGDTTLVVKTRTNPITGGVVSFQISKANKDKVKLDLVKGKLSVLLRNLRDEDLNFDDGLDVLVQLIVEDDGKVRFRRGIATLPAAVIGTKVTLSGAEGELQDAAAP